MSAFTFNARASRVVKARLARRLGSKLLPALKLVIIASVIGTVILAFTHRHIAYSVAGLAMLMTVLYIWIRNDLVILAPAPIGTTQALDQLLPADIVADYRQDQTALEFWGILERTRGARFIMVRFELHPDDIRSALEHWPLTHDALWTETVTAATRTGSDELSTAVIFAALFHLSPELSSLGVARKLEQDDIDEGVRWLDRLDGYLSRKRPSYGGIARDWAAGFTPRLANYGTNLSRRIEFTSRNLGAAERTDQLDALVTGLNSASGSVVLIGDPGIGKTALLLGLADRLLQGLDSGSLAHHQIIALDASTIISGASAPGDIERIVLDLLGEAVSAGNIVIALDEAQLFFGQGTGAVNLSQLLLPILQTRSLKLVLAVSPGDWQRLRATNTSMASLLTPLVLSEPSELEVLRLEADRALGFEAGRFITTYRALGEAYRLSGRYFDEEAYPGRALKLLEAATNYPDGTIINERSVQQAIESQFGVKVQTADATETDVLIHLEDHIHERMINQTRAVSVVANALRRSRAGVANPKRPIGSFLFLGPTGVGKTELAKSLAALYFGSEGSVIRLDMSEYQQIADVDRILAGAAENPQALLARLRQQPFSVVLFDEIEKAHPNVLNLFLQLLDEGNLTDTTGRATSFKDAIVIATSNAGADEIRAHIEAGEEIESFETQFTNDLIGSGAFKPELLNRFDEIVLFRPLKQPELAQVVGLMIKEVNETLATQKLTVSLTDAATIELVETGYDPRLGARPMRRMVQRRVEDAVAKIILGGATHPGDTIVIGAENESPRIIPAHPSAANHS